MTLIICRFISSFFANTILTASLVFDIFLYDFFDERFCTCFLPLRKRWNVSEAMPDSLLAYGLRGKCFSPVVERRAVLTGSLRLFGEEGADRQRPDSKWFTLPFCDDEMVGLSVQEGAVHLVHDEDHLRHLMNQSN